MDLFRFSEAEPFQAGPATAATAATSPLGYDQTLEIFRL